MARQHYVIALRPDGSRLVLVTLQGADRARSAADRLRQCEGYTRIWSEPARGARKCGADRRKQRA